MKTRDNPLYLLWANMKSRCNNPKATDYDLYGGRGIRVCESWSKFENFERDMSPRPPGTTLDRIENNKGYEPGNVRWATAHEQAANKRGLKYYEFDGKRMTATSWSKVLGISISQMVERLKVWPLHIALTTPRLTRREIYERMRAGKLKKAVHPYPAGTVMTLTKLHSVLFP